MDEPTTDESIPPAEPRLTRQGISAAVSGLGWQFILGTLQTYVLVTSLAEAAGVIAAVTVATGAQADQSLRADVRTDRVVLTLQSADTGWVTPREIDLAGQISALVTGLGLKTSVDGSPAGAAPATRTVQGLEIAIDTLDTPAIRPFWQAVLGYVDEPGQDGPLNGLVDPVGQGPAVWFQQMDAPRPQRNRIHFDISVPPDEAADRIAAALAAGGRLLSDDEAPAFWVLADPEGNEACICTWQGRDA